ncbi:hypothetical protein PHMEG_00025173 [Phytophthora megakarya]|uniref:Uncharacterized protein n=1 Tax=Phytophthora megakarya TaxID=4795 RepID=A0A225VE37_9STRA|nr:hypothetical protein PHMEG_00025173 [Phytophthora megakarya]
MKRRKRANVVMLSSEEKYCYAKAVFELVMEYLASLSSPAFYVVLQSWKLIVRRGLDEVGAYTSDATTVPDDNSDSDISNSLHDDISSDTASDMYPADLIDSINMIRELEQSNHIQGGTTVNACKSDHERNYLDEKMPFGIGFDCAKVYFTWQCARRSGNSDTNLGTRKWFDPKLE